MNEKLLNILRQVDTPTICNAIEGVQGKRGLITLQKKQCIFLKLIMNL